MAGAKFFFKCTLFLHGFLGIKIERVKKNPSWCHSGKSSEQNKTSNIPTGLIDFCQTCQPGSKMSFRNKHVQIFDCGLRKNKNAE